MFQHSFTGISSILGIRTNSSDISCLHISIYIFLSTRFTLNESNYVSKRNLYVLFQFESHHRMYSSEGNPIPIHLFSDLIWSVLCSKKEVKWASYVVNFKISAHLFSHHFLANPVLKFKMNCAWDNYDRLSPIYILIKITSLRFSG